MAFKKEDYWIKPRINLVDYQIRVFKNALKIEEKAYQHLLDNQENRKKSYRLDYDSMDEIIAAYRSGLIDLDEYKRQKYAFWQVYSDRGKRARIKWLKDELAAYESQMQAIEDILEDKRRNQKEAEKKRVERERQKKMKIRLQRKLNTKKQRNARRNKKRREATRQKRINRWYAWANGEDGDDK